MSEERVPLDIREMVLQIGKADWSSSGLQTDEGHMKGFQKLLDGTRMNHQVGDVTEMHGIVTVQTPFPLSIATVGNSPNSPLVARALCGAWNHLVDLCESERDQDDIKASMQAEAADGYDISNHRSVKH